MSSYRILVVHSVEDSITRHRIERINRSPILADHVFEHFYLVNLTQKQQSLGTRDLMQSIISEQIKKDRLYRELKTKIKRFKPEILIIHAGFVFTAFSEEIIAVISQLKSDFPSLRIGLESRRWIVPRKELFDKVFDTSDEVMSLTDQIL